MADVISGTKCNKVCIVCWGRHGHTACTPGKSVAQLVRELLQAVSSEPVVIVEHVVVSWPTCTLGQNTAQLGLMLGLMCMCTGRERRQETGKRFGSGEDEK